MYPRSSTDLVSPHPHEGATKNTLPGSLSLFEITKHYCPRASPRHQLFVAMRGLGPVEPAALKHQANSWNLAEIDVWANNEFPNEFQVVPTSSSLTFKDCVEEGKAIPGVKLLFIGKGLWASRSQSSPNLKIIYAFVNGARSNHVGLLMKGLGANGREKRVLADLDGLLDAAGIRGLLCLQRPFCHLGEMSGRLEIRAAMPRFRALVLYLFMRSGHIDYVGGYQAYPRDLQLACNWIAAGGVRPKPTPFDTMPKRQAGSRGGNTAVQSAEETAASVVPTFEDQTQQNSSQDPGQRESEVCIHSLEFSTNSIAGSHDTASEIEKAGDTSAALFSDLSTEGNNLKRLLYRAGDACEKVETDRKRVKQDLDAMQAENEHFKSANETLVAENLRLQGELRIAEELKSDQTQSDSGISQALAEAEKKVEDAEKAANLKLSNCREKHAA